MKIENIILSFGKVIARATSDFAEAESLLKEHGKTTGRKVSEKRGLSSSRTVEVGILVEHGWSKDKVKRTAEAARILNAFDILAAESGISAEELESSRLDILAKMKAEAEAVAVAPAKTETETKTK